MDESYTQAFYAVVDFVDALWENFNVSKKATPLSLYRRIVCHIEDKNTGKLNADGVNKVLSGFRQFLCIYEKHILDNNLDRIPRGVVIKYGDSNQIHLEIQKYIYQCNRIGDKDMIEVMREHLITISAILEPNKDKMEEKMAVLDNLSELGVDTSTKEGQFLGNILEKAKNSVSGMEPSGNGAVDMMNIFQSGMIQDMMSGMQGVQSGELDHNKMINSMIGILQTFSNATQQAPQQTMKVEEIQDNALEHKD